MILHAVLRIQRKPPAQTPRLSNLIHTDSSSLETQYTTFVFLPKSMEISLTKPDTLLCNHMKQLVVAKYRGSVGACIGPFVYVLICCASWQFLIVFQSLEPGPDYARN